MELAEQAVHSLAILDPSSTFGGQTFRYFGVLGLSETFGGQTFRYLPKFIVKSGIFAKITEPVAVKVLKLIKI